MVMNKVVSIIALLFIISGCETVNEAGRSIETAVDNLGENSKRAAKDVGDAGNDFADRAKSGGDE
jgi:hypothetical protein